MIRKEERYYLSKQKADEFKKEIKEISFLRKFKDNYSKTIYFNNDEHEVPFGLSIKARKYDSFSWGKTVSLNENEMWILEIKKDILSKNSRLREKERNKLILKEIIQSLQRGVKGMIITSPLRPFTADEYIRQHYIISIQDDFRITVDDAPKYYFFESGLTGINIGIEDYSRIEMKVPEPKLNSKEFKRIRDILKGLKAEPTISKKDMSYNFLSSYLKEKFNRKVDSSNTEIEAKLSLNQNEQHLFHKIKKDFDDGFINSFRVTPSFPYTLESAKLHLYVNSGDDSTDLRIGIKEKSKSLTSKSDSEIVKDPLGLNCIIKRNEIKKTFSPDLLDLQSLMLYRKRKYFLVEKKDDIKSYAIIIDRCTREKEELFQMEIEGLLKSPTKEEEKKVISDIANITNQLIQRYPTLKPMPVTKSEWLKSI